MTIRENVLRGRTTPEGRVVEIVKSDGTVLRQLDGVFAWGPMDMKRGVEGVTADNIGRVALAKAILGWVMGENDLRVTQYYQRYKHRVTMTLSPDWQLRVGDVQRMIEDIQEIEAETAQSRTMVALTPNPVASEGGNGVVWHTDAEGKPTDWRKNERGPS
jgi:hypothetical protein